MSWPLPGVEPTLPPPEGRFGAVRRHDVHTGLDLYCPEGTRVAAIEPGEVVAVVPFTGPDAGSPWWLPTDAVLVEDADGIWLYGEVQAFVTPGRHLSIGDPLGSVRRVLRHDKGRPTVMLHLERYAPGVREPVWWHHGDPQPPLLRDPLARLMP